MRNRTFFLQECPTCGRKAEIRVEYLGKHVVCRHCRGEFIALDPASKIPSPHGSSLLERADELLEMAEVYRAR